MLSSCASFWWSGASIPTDRCGVTPRGAPQNEVYPLDVASAYLRMAMDLKLADKSTADPEEEFALQEKLGEGYHLDQRAGR